MITQQIDPETQKRLNEPLKNPRGYSQEDQIFLQSIMTKIESGQIKLYIPSSLFNLKVYDAFPEDQKSRVEMQAYSLLASLREIHGFAKAYVEPTFQLQNLVHKVRLVKEQFETKEGDVFIV